MILLDTNAIIRLEQNHPRTRGVLKAGRLFVSPVSLLELRMLEESGRARFRTNPVDAIVTDDRWRVDDPSSLDLLTAALEMSWTRDPYDRMLAGHAKMRGWRLATSDQRILEHLDPRYTLEL